MRGRDKAFLSVSLPSLLVSVSYSPTQRLPCSLPFVPVSTNSLAFFSLSFLIFPSLMLALLSRTFTVSSCLLKLHHAPVYIFATSVSSLLSFSFPLSPPIDAERHV